MYGESYDAYLMRSHSCYGAVDGESYDARSLLSGGLNDALFLDALPCHPDISLMLNKLVHCDGAFAHICLCVIYYCLHCLGPNTHDS